MKATRTRKASHVRVDHETGLAYVELTQGKQAVIDADDLDIVAMHKWFAKKSRTNVFYAMYTPKGKRLAVPMHRLIMGLGDWDGRTSVDHINGDGLDNRRVNLRIASPTVQKLNQRTRNDNTSGTPGVHLRPDGMWQSRISVKGKRFSLGLFSDKATAVAFRESVNQVVSFLLEELSTVGREDNAVQE